MKLSAPVFLVLSGKPQANISPFRWGSLLPRAALPTTSWRSSRLCQVPGDSRPLLWGSSFPGHVSIVQRGKKAWRPSTSLKEQMLVTHIQACVISVTRKFLRRFSDSGKNTAVASRSHLSRESEILAREYMCRIRCTYIWMVKYI